MTEHFRVINSEEGMKRAKDDLCITATMDYIKEKELKRAAPKNQKKYQGIKDREPLQKCGL